MATDSLGRGRWYVKKDASPSKELRIKKLEEEIRNLKYSIELKSAEIKRLMGEI